MEILHFITLYKKAFGETAPLPIVFGYSDKAAVEIRKIPRCMIGAIRKVCEGISLTLSADNVLCSGGSLYTAFAPMKESTPVFVSEVEHYKRTEEMVRKCIGKMDIRLTEKPYLNFVRMDMADNLDNADGVLFFASPDILAGLCSWAFYDNNADDAVSVRFASGCCSMITFAVNENKQRGRSCFIGMLDPSARPLIPKDELSFSIPMCRFMEMMQTMEDSALFQKAFTVLSKRI